MGKARNENNQKKLQGNTRQKIQRKDSSVNMAGKAFSWTEEETALLLKVALECKTAKLAEGKDWQTIQDRKYEDLAAAFANTYSLKGATGRVYQDR